MAGSGYNQDTNQITPVLYRVGITMTSSSNYPVATANTASGGVWPYDWNNPVYTNASVLSAAQALVLAQGNIRWTRIIELLDGMSDCRIENVSITAANGSTLATDATNQPTAINFTVSFDRDAPIVGNWNNYLKSLGNATSGTYANNDGSTATAYVGVGGTAVTTTALAVQDIVTSAILTGGSTGYKRTYRVYNPVASGDSQLSVTITQPNASASTIFGTVSASQISGTALSGSPL
jgi:hypothetical protein